MAGNFNPDEKLIKRPQDDVPLTRYEVDEWIKCASDFYYFCENYVYVQGENGRTLFTPRDYQHRVIDTAMNNTKTISLVGRQAGKRLALDTIVPTPDGYTTIGDISVEDVIIGQDGKPTTVVFLSPIEEHPDAYELEFSTGEVVKADAEHLWTVNHRTGSGIRKKTLTTQDMVDAGLYKTNTNNECKFTIDTADAVVGEHTSLPIDPYVFGYWLGDGSSRCSYIHIGIAGDVDSLSSYCDEHGIEYSILPLFRNDTVVRFRVHGLTTQLRQLGVLQNKHIPIQYLRASKEQRIALLQGLMDSDGHVNKRGGFEITLKQKVLIDAVHELISSLGTQVHLPKERKIFTYNKEGCVYYRLHGKVCLSEYSMVRLRRKAKNLQKEPHRTRKRSTKIRQIVDIRKTDPVPMRCLQVDNKDHLFCVTRSHIPTHNTISFCAYALWRMTFTADYQVGISSFQNVNVLDFCQRISFAYQTLPFFLKEPCTKFSQFSISFSNGSSVYGQVTSERFGRGKSLSLILLDELAFVDAKISNELMGSLLGTLSANGENSQAELHIISTPNGTQGAFYEIWSSALLGESMFVPVTVEYEEVPGRGPDENGIDHFYETTMKSGISRDRFDQEFRCVFISSSGTLVNSRFLESIKASSVLREVGDVKLFIENFNNRKVAIACDPAEGVGEDYSAIQIFDIDTFEQLGEYTNNMVNQSQLVNQLAMIVKLCYSEGATDVFYCYESNGIGSAIGILIDGIEDETFLNATMISDVTRMLKGKTGMATTARSKKAACGQFKDLVEMDKITIRSQRLINELKTFVKKGASFEAQPGNNDDTVSACLLFTRMLNELRNYEESVDDVISSVDLTGNDNDDFSDIYF